jgi:hypothetical protein
MKKDSICSIGINMKNIIILFTLLLVSCSTNRNIHTPTSDVVEEDTLIFVVDTTDNPRETFYILTNGTIIDGVEFDRIVREAWDNAFGDMTDEEKELFKGDAKGSYLREMIQGISVLRFTTWVVLTVNMINASVLELQPPIELFSLVDHLVY